MKYFQKVLVFNWFKSFTLCNQWIQIGDILNNCYVGSIASWLSINILGFINFSWATAPRNSTLTPQIWIFKPTILVSQFLFTLTVIVTHNQFQKTFLKNLSRCWKRWTRINLTVSSLQLYSKVGSSLYVHCRIRRYTRYYNVVGEEFLV